jgi:NAD(P)-dependent dehydrogenase (short-subunit alcohol dehydrogenase family)
MQSFKDKVAVITGAASGIGRGLARHCADEGIQIVLADVDERGLAELLEQLVANGGRAIAVPTDVSDLGEVERLRDAALGAYGAVHLVFNNAGVLLTGYAWERTAEDWEWVLGVNLWGAINGVRAFMPLLIRQGEPAHMVNTASVGGLLAGPLLGPYTVSKYGIVGLSETVHLELSTLDVPVGISCLCPGAVSTGIMDADRNRPDSLSPTTPQGEGFEQMVDEAMRSGIEEGMGPDELARVVFAAIRAGQFWILSEAIYDDPIRDRAESIIAGHGPALAPFLAGSS